MLFIPGSYRHDVIRIVDHYRHDVIHSGSYRHDVIYKKETHIR